MPNDAVIRPTVSAMNHQAFAQIEFRLGTKGVGMMDVYVESVKLELTAKLVRIREIC